MFLSPDTMFMIGLLLLMTGSCAQSVAADSRLIARVKRWRKRATRRTTESMVTGDWIRKFVAVGKWGEGNRQRAAGMNVHGTRKGDSAVRLTLSRLNRELSLRIGGMPRAQPCTRLPYCLPI